VTAAVVGIGLPYDQGSLKALTLPSKQKAMSSWNCSNARGNSH